MMEKEVVKEFSEEEVLLLNQLVNMSEDSFDNLKMAYEKKDPVKFNKFKAVLIQTQRRISEIVK